MENVPRNRYKYNENSQTPIWSWYDLSSEKRTYSSIEVMLLSDIHTWKSVRIIILKIMLELFLKDSDNKLLLAKHFANNYKEMIKNYSKIELKI